MNNEKMGKLLTLVENWQTLAAQCEECASKVLNKMGPDLGHVFAEKELSSAKALRFAAQQLDEVINEPT